VAHESFEHHHHLPESVKSNHSHDENDGGHNLFSFGQLDEAYIHSNNSIDVSNALPTLACLQILFSFQLSVPVDTRDFYLVQVFPPPDNPYCHSPSFRGPPLS
jgi:hypothetical protein